MTAAMMTFPLNTSDILRSAALRYPKQSIVSALPGGQRHQYGYLDLLHRTSQLANRLSAEGVEQGARLATLAVNHYRHLELYYGISGMGAVVHTLNARLFSEQLSYIINHAEDTWVFVDPEFLPMLEAVADEIPSVQRFILLCDEAEMPASSSLKLECYETLLAGQPTEFSWPRLSSDTPCGLCYTSGTTGNPKGVLYEQGSTVLHAMMSGSSQYLDFNEWSVAMPVVPMYHVCAWGVPFSAPMYGAKLVLPGAGLDGESLQQLIEDEQVNQAFAVPTIWLNLHNYLQSSGKGIDSLKMVGVGGAASPRALAQTYDELYQVYWMGIWGMTETSPLATAAVKTPEMANMTPEQRYELQSSAGRPMFGVEIEIFDEAGRPLPHDGVTRGNLRCRGPWILAQYYRGEGADKFVDGWFETGDVAVINAEGYLRVVDRSKDVIKSGGEWISSVELENAALHDEAVNEACVIGATHPKWDERPIMLVTVKPGKLLDEARLRDTLQQKVAKWWLPDAIIQVEDLPHTGTGKLRKVELRQSYKDYLLAK